MTAQDLEAVFRRLNIRVNAAGQVREAEAARVLDVQRETLCRWRRADPNFPCVRIGARYRYTAEDLLELMKRR